jgi:hypothetical protein
MAHAHGDAKAAERETAFDGAGAERAERVEGGGRTSLRGDVLLALQLRACGYTDAQIASLMRQPSHSPAGIATLLTQAARRLGAPNIDRAIREAKRRGLIT